MIHSKTLPHRENNKNIILIGMPGAGKSTVGVLLAKQIGFSFIDTDVSIQTQENRLLSEIILEEGLDQFCAIENRHLEAINTNSHVIATGGSAIYSTSGMNHLKKQGSVIYLETGPEILESRVVDATRRGVVKKPGQTLKDLFTERHPLYLFWADHVIPCDNSLSPSHTTTAIMEFLNHL